MRRRVKNSQIRLHARGPLSLLTGRLRPDAPCAWATLGRSMPDASLCKVVTQRRRINGDLDRARSLMGSLQ